MTHQKNDQQDEPGNGLELESYDFSVELDLELMGIESEETEEEEPPKEILDLLKRHEGIEHSSEVAEIINLGTAEDPKEVKIGTALSPEQRLAIFSFLQSEKDVFAWSYQDMPGLDTDLVVHRLPLYPDAKPVKQKLRRMRPEWSEKIKEEVMKQFNAGFLAVSTYPDWLANIVPVPKKDGKVLEFQFRSVSILRLLLREERFPPLLKI